jgi:hypothetical protein
MKVAKEKKSYLPHITIAGRCLPSLKYNPLKTLSITSSSLSPVQPKRCWRYKKDPIGVLYVSKRKNTRKIFAKG